ncbi:MAG: helix-turn-helix domain-containing protein [Hydrogeniiclostridium mannosilyticum]
MPRNTYQQRRFRHAVPNSNGHAVCEIVRETGVPRSTIYHWVKQYKDLMIL